jgi:hypothetical protein
MRELLDLLVEKTQQLSKMRDDRIGGSALEDCKNTVKELQNIIQTRKVISEHIRKNKRTDDAG